MSRIPGIRRMLRLPLSESTVERDIDEELAFHIDARAQELIARGAAPAAARQQAEREYGDMSASRAELLAVARTRVKRERRADWWDAAGHELRLSARGLLRAPGFTAAVVVMLALGIGVNAAMFGLTDRLLLSAPPHVQDPDDLVRVMYQSTPPYDPTLRVESVMAYADYVTQRDEVRAFQAIAAYSTPNTPAVGRGESATELKVISVTPSYFTVLGVQPALGRFFTEAEGAEPQGERVVVLSHGLWQSHFGGAASALGEQIEIDQELFTVIGVAPRGFYGIDLEPVEAWLPISAVAGRLGENWYSTRAMSWVRLVARLAPGVSVDAAAAEATAAYLPPYEVRYGGDPTARVILGSVIAARAPAVGHGTPQRSGRIALWLLGVSAIVLIIACANAANLLLARGLRRRREIGVRLAMGVSRARLAGQVMTETLLITALGAALGLLLAHWGGQLVRSLLLPEFEWTGSPVDRRMLLFAAVAALGSALLAGLIPALHAARADVVDLLALGGRGGTYRRSPVRAGLLVLQATLSVVLLVGAGLFVRSLHNARSVPLGFDHDSVMLLSWHRTGAGWNTARTLEVYDASLERVRTLPQVEAAALSFNAPFYSAAGASITVPGRDSVPRPQGMFGFMYDAVSPDYFRTMGTRVLRGRTFTERDVAGAPLVAIVTTAFAEWVWPGEDAIGKCFRHARGQPDEPCREVVGIVEHVRYRNVEDEPATMFFLPLAQGPSWPMRVLSIRTYGDPEHAIPAIRQALHAMEPGLPHVQLVPLRHRVEPQLQLWRMGALLFSAFGALALLLAALGLYGVMAYDVAQRTREFGVRLALGARAGNVMGIVLGDAFRVVVLGLGAGIALALWVAPRLESLLFNVEPRDHAVILAVTAVLLLVGCAATLLPGWRAVRIQPVEALREE